MKFLFWKKPEKSTAFSVFIRKARSSDKKKVYNEVLHTASDEQIALIQKAANDQHHTSPTP